MQPASELDGFKLDIFPPPPAARIHVFGFNSTKWYFIVVDQMKSPNSVGAVQRRGEAVRDPRCCEILEPIDGGIARQRIQLHRLVTTDRFRLVLRRMSSQEFIDQFADNLLLTQVAEIAWPA